MVGAAIKGRKVIIIDDVITAGTAIRESAKTVETEGGGLKAIVVSLDRQEKPFDTASKSAIQLIEEDLNIPVLAVARLKHILGYLLGASTESAAESAVNTRKVDAIRLYRDRYGVYY